jgi:hypothetical protein
MHNHPQRLEDARAHRIIGIVQHRTQGGHVVERGGSRSGVILSIALFLLQFCAL